MVNFNAIEQKWQKRWAKAKLGEAKKNKNKKFFMIFAYPGISGYLHVGHFRGYSYTDAICRYMRMKGYNVLFPVGTHASGNQAINFANKVKNNDKAWMEYLKNNGCPAGKIKDLADPIKNVEFFNKEYLKTWKRFGFLADWRRFTCTIYEDYSKFIQWQFLKLRQKGLLIQKPYYATFCNVCGPVAVDPSETDISKGGNADKVEYVLLKFKLDNLFLVAATLRPETVYGQTNLWINPDIVYVKARVGGEEWILSREAAGKLMHQKDNVDIIAEVDSKNFIGKYCLAPGVNKEIIILPSGFPKPDIGSGIVTSVPSDAPYDYVALKELQDDKALAESYCLDYEAVRSIRLIPIIKSKGYGDFPGKDAAEKYKIATVKDIKHLEIATQEVYKAGYHTGIMNENCGQYSGLAVAEAKDRVRDDLIKNKKADVFWDLSEEVVCRCGNKVHVKLVNDQWFIDYGNKRLTDESKAHAFNMKIAPEEFHRNIPSVLEWFQERACARLGNWLGTRLPFDEKWIIEPISDSTLYPIYYLISPYVNEKRLRPDNLSEAFFDYVFLGKGDAKKIKISKNLLKQIRKDFLYWYPLDLNLGGKEHQTVHFPVFIMNHVAVLNKAYWPKGIIVNWWVTGKGDKISKSKGGAEPISGAIERYSVDAMRLYYCHVGGFDTDIVWEGDTVKKYRAAVERLFLIIDSVKRFKNAKLAGIDNWLASRLNSKLVEIENAMANNDLRQLSDIIYFSLYNDFRWYIRRGGCNKKGMREFMDAWIRLMAVVTPHAAEELWNRLKFKGMVSSAKWPHYDKRKINEKADVLETLIEQARQDTVNVLGFVKFKPKRIRLFVADSWKYDLFKKIKKQVSHTRDAGKIIKKIIDKRHGREIARLVPAVLADLNRLYAADIVQKDEFNALVSASSFFNDEFKITVSIENAEDSSEEKAKGAMPGKPSILVE